jgi:hypothetical protein
MVRIASLVRIASRSWLPADGGERQKYGHPYQGGSRDRRSTGKYLTAQRARCERASHAERLALLDEIVAVTGYQRKAVIPPPAEPAAPHRGAAVGRPRRCGPAVAATVCWAAASQIGAKRLQPFVLA